MYQSQQTGPPGALSPGGQATSRHRQPQRFPTRSHLPEGTRTDLIDRLNATLADTTILVTHAKFAHWNVKGMAFWGLHELFDELADVLAGHVDLVAERVTALGGQAMGTAGMAVANCRLPMMPADATTGEEYVGLLAERLAIHDANLYDDIEAATGLQDLDTADLLNEISREVSQYRWFLEAHHQTRPIPPEPTGGGAQPGQPAPGGQPHPSGPGDVRP